MKIIGIGGAHSGIGKTTLASKLINHIVNEKAEKIFGVKWGAIKYSRTDFYSSLTNDESILSTKDKDTARLLSSGAKEVYWIQSPPEELNETIPIALEKLSYLDGIVVEGNSAIDFIKPNIIVFLHSNKEIPLKKTASSLINKSDLVIHFTNYNRENICSDNHFDIITYDINSLDFSEFFSIISNKLIDKELKRLLIENNNENKITCSKANEIAKLLSIPHKRVGDMINSMKIKITKCELGCF